MSTSVAPRQSSTAAVRRTGRWIDHWEPENELFWNSVGNKTARRNLTFSILSEHVGFSVWVIWSVMVLLMPPAAWHFTVADKFLITTVPAAVGSFVRLPYTFAVAKFGGRNWTVISALMLLVPSLVAVVVVRPGISLTELLLVTALFGVGGGNFASSMANINNFYPQRLKGRALGLNAGGGNIGVATVQILGAVVIATHRRNVDPRVMLYIYIPLITVVATLAWFTMNNLAEATNDQGAMRAVARNKHTWIISLLYVGTFGSFIGFGFAFGQVLADSGVKSPIYYVWIGAFAGSLIRPVGGMLADRYRGSIVSLVNFLAMAVVTTVVLVTARSSSIPLFVAAFTVLFALTGIGNGSVYKMIPAILHGQAMADPTLDPTARNVQARRLSSALVGVAGAVGAFGGVLVQFAFRQSFLGLHSGDAAYIGFIAFYALCGIVTWVVYVRTDEVALAGV